MAEYLTNTTDLTKVASAIREKGGTSNSLVYPDGFVTAIQSIDVTGGGGTCTVTLTCEASDSYITYLSLDGVWYDRKLLQAGVNRFQVMQKSPLFISNMYSLDCVKLVNIVNTGLLLIISDGSGAGMYYKMYYATASTASATQPTD